MSSPVDSSIRVAPRTKLRTVTFKADEVVMAALATLEAALGGHVRAKRSSAIRRALLEAAASLPRKASAAETGGASDRREGRVRRIA